ncbi:MAG: hypothetical protein AMXMBFR13_34630 [Phycisphaerae bacterium]
MRAVIAALEAGLEPTTSCYATGLWATIEAMIGKRAARELQEEQSDWRARRRMGGVG